MVSNTLYKNLTLAVTDNTNYPTTAKSVDRNEDKSVVWKRIEHLSNEMIATAEAGDWTGLLRLENEWLKNIQHYVEKHRVQKDKPAPLAAAHLATLVSLNDDLYQQCQQSRATAGSKLDDIRQSHAPKAAVAADEAGYRTPTPRMGG